MIKDCDLCILYSFGQVKNPNIKYLTGYDDNGLLLLTKRKKILIVADRDYEKAKRQSNVEVKKRKQKRFFENIRFRPKKIGIDKSYYYLNDFEELKKIVGGQYIDITDELQQKRTVKTKKEIQYLKHACKVTDNVFTKIINNFRFKTELDLKLFIEFEIKRQGCELSFDPIVASQKSRKVFCSWIMVQGIKDTALT